MLLTVNASVGYANPPGFYLDSLPNGAEVTLPQPATTYVSLANRVSITSTDSPQVVSMKSIHLKNGAVPKIRVSIFDPKQPRVVHADLLPDSPFLYKMSKLGTISIVPDSDAAKNSNDICIRLESDKPLTLRH